MNDRYPTTDNRRLLRLQRPEGCLEALLDALSVPIHRAHLRGALLQAMDEAGVILVMKR